MTSTLTRTEEAQLRAAPQEEATEASIWALRESFREFLDLDAANGRCSPHTEDTYLRGVMYWLAWCQENDVTPALAKPRHIKTYRNYLDAKYSPSSARVYLTVVRRFYDAAVENELIGASPAGTIRSGQAVADTLETMKALNSDGLAALIANMPRTGPSALRDRGIVSLMAIQGLRRTEVHRLNHKDIQDLPDGWAVRILGKGNKLRTALLRKDVLKALSEWIEAKGLLGFGTGPEDPVFTSMDNATAGMRLSNRSLNRVVDKYLGQANLKRDGVSCHALRHTFGTLSVAGGAKVEQVRDAMGHSKLETTGIYVKAVERAQNNPALFIGPTFD